MERYTKYIDPLLKPTTSYSFDNQYKVLINAIISSMISEGDDFLLESSALIGITIINIKMMSESAFRNFEELIWNYWDYFHFAKKHPTQHFSVYKDYKEGKIIVTIEVVGKYRKIKYRIESNISFSKKLIDIKGN
jgi:hypothetical protein